MSKKALLIRQIKQKSNTTFSIIWNDGYEQNFLLSSLQKRCPCANCTDEQTGKQLVDPHAIKDEVRAIVIRNIGRYALQVQFTSGCSMGIYSFDMLRQMGSKDGL